ncbi:hypothetical protein A2U01_0032353 [Trifolium medium]|uniref:Uncharacterized protein n=1 Tax=Trifolium medium TaxID=97028 RepID=A0A392PGM8_9FABA|nr:hypothetical protein [Trifolium medium]
MIFVSGGKSGRKEEKEDGDDIRERSLRDGHKGHHAPAQKEAQKSASNAIL